MPKTLLSLQNLIFHFMPDKAFKETGLSKKAMISLTHSMKCLDFTRCLRNIKCPVLIICGSKDKANLKSASLLSELLPNASLATYCFNGGTDVPDIISGNGAGNACSKGSAGHLNQLSYIR